MDQLRALKYFMAVAETGSFTKAGERFKVPASSISRRIADLEDHLQANLLQRSTRTVQLTEVGQDYFQQIKPLVEGLSFSDDSVRTYTTEPMGTLRISTMTSFGERLLMPVLDEFTARYPKIMIDVHLSDEITHLERDNIDIAIRGGYVPNERIVATKLMDNRFIPLASPKYLKHHGHPKHPLELKQHRGLYFRTPVGRTPWLAHVDGQWQDVSGQAIAVTNHGQWLVDQAIAGKGILFVPRWTATDILEDGTLVELSFDEEVNITTQQDFGVYLLYQKHRHAVPKIKAAVDLIVQRLKTKSV